MQRQALFAALALSLGAGLSLTAQVGNLGSLSTLNRDLVRPSEGPAGPPAFGPFLYVNGIYDTGISTPNLSGRPSFVKGTGVEAGGGLAYRLDRRRTFVKVKYEGNVHRYSPRSTLDSSNHFLDFNITHLLGRRLTVSLDETAGRVDRNFGLAITPVSGISIGALPLSDFFGMRTTFTESRATLGYLHSRRLSFTGGADFVVVRSQAPALYGYTGSTFRGELSYRLTRRSIIGIDYGFTHYMNARTFGGLNIHALNVGYTTRLSRSLELKLRFGGMRGQLVDLALVQLDLEIARILGQSVGARVLFKTFYLPSYQALITKKFRYTEVQMFYQRALFPGGDVLSVSLSNRGGVSVDYTIGRHWAITSEMSYSTRSSLRYAAQQFDEAIARVGMIRDLSPAVQAITFVEARHWDVTGPISLNRVFYGFRAGLVFHPETRPVLRQ